MSGRLVSDPPLFYACHIFCCLNKRPEGHERGCCADKGSERLRAYMKRRVQEKGLQGVRVNGAGCLDRCALGPCVVIYPEGVWYAPKTEGDIDEILDTHVKQGGRVERLLLREDRGSSKSSSPS